MWQILKWSYTSHVIPYRTHHMLYLIFLWLLWRRVTRLLFNIIRKPIYIVAVHVAPYRCLEDMSEKGVNYYRILFKTYVCTVVLNGLDRQPWSSILQTAYTIPLKLFELDCFKYKLNINFFQYKLETLMYMYRIGSICAFVSSLKNAVISKEVSIL